jgi:hypothetical protein
MDDPLQLIENQDDSKHQKPFEVSQAQAIFDALTLLICLLPGAPLPLIAINTVGTSYEPWIPVAAIISAIQYGLLGYLLYLLSPWLTFVLACCLLPFYLNLLMGIIKPRSIAP